MNGVADAYTTHQPTSEVLSKSTLSGSCGGGWQNVFFFGQILIAINLFFTLENIQLI